MTTTTGTRAPVLTEREIRILTLTAAGNTNQAIGSALEVSTETIKTNFRILLKRLGARDRTHAVALAYQRGLLPLPIGSTPRVLQPRWTPLEVHR